jgi:hypothetical protein
MNGLELLELFDQSGPELTDQECEVILAGVLAELRTRGRKLTLLHTDSALLTRVSEVCQRNVRVVNEWANESSLHAESPRHKDGSLPLGPT